MDELAGLRLALADIEAEVRALQARRAALPPHGLDEIELLRAGISSARVLRNALLAILDRRLASAETPAATVSADDHDEFHETPVRAE